MPTHADGPGVDWPSRLGQLALALVMAVVLLPSGVPAIDEGGLSRGWSVPLFGALAALHVSVATARRWPRLSFSFGTLGCAVLLVAPDVNGVGELVEAGDYSPILLPSTLCFFALVYSVSAHTRAPWPGIALGAGLLGSCLTLARLWGFTGTPIDTWAWWLLLGTTMFGGTVGAWGLGRYRVTRAAWTLQLSERAAADERRRIAREMHDVVAHSLAVVVSHAEAGRLVVPGSPERATEILTTIAEAGRGALTEMRGLLGVLRDDDLSTEPQPGLQDLPALVDRVRAAGVDVKLSMDERLQAPPTVALTVYRVVQEALTNVTRHAGRRSTAQVGVAGSADGIDVLITNTGSVPANPGTGRGLVGMRERVDAVGGTLESGRSDAGWRVHAKVPW